MKDGQVSIEEEELDISDERVSGEAPPNTQTSEAISVEESEENSETDNEEGTTNKIDGDSDYPSAERKYTWFGKIADRMNAAYIKATEFHFEKRDELNGMHVSYEEVIAKDSEWVKLPTEMSIYHDNKVGNPELKFVHPDGREAVFDGDTLEPILDPRYKATYNYVTPAQPPENLFDIAGWIEFIKKGIGHFIKDMLPYYLTGFKNERNQKNKEVKR
ncbi:MAG: hypothetical protein ACOYVK_07315 [Bacillota bacterium]